MAFIILGDLVVLILFAAAVSLARAAFGGEFSPGAVALNIGWELFGSVLVGFLLGLILLVYLERVGKELTVFLLGLCFATAEGGTRLHLSPLLMSLAAGGLLANLSPNTAGRLHVVMQRAGLPVFALFFAAAGAGLHLDTVVKVGPIAVLLALVRGVTLYLTCRRFAPKDEPAVQKLLWMGLISQAGVTFGLASLVERSFPEFGADAATLLIAMITLHELVGPVLVRKALITSGETHLEEHGVKRARRALRPIAVQRPAAHPRLRREAAAAQRVGACVRDRPEPGWTRPGPPRSRLPSAPQDVLTATRRTSAAGSPACSRTPQVPLRASGRRSTWQLRATSVPWILPRREVVACPASA